VLAAKDAMQQRPTIFSSSMATPVHPAGDAGATRTPLAAGAAVAVWLSAVRSFGYGRLITHGEELIAIREEADASEQERAIDFCNGGIVALAAKAPLPSSIRSATTIANASSI